jgi:hypothetical protein
MKAQIRRLTATNFTPLRSPHQKCQTPPGKVPGCHVWHVVKCHYIASLVLLWAVEK